MDGGGAGGVPPFETGGTGPIFAGGRPTDAGTIDSGDGGPPSLDIYIVLDQSLSMSCQTASGKTRWDEVTAVLGTFVQTAGPNIGVGLGYFGLSPSGIPFLSSCLVTDYVPDVEIGPLPANAKPIVDSLGAHGPATNTPTLPALQGAIDHAIAWKAQNTGSMVVVVLVTDGQPNSCGTIPELLNVAGAGFKGGTIPTYVIGVVSPGVDCGTLDPNPPNVPDLDAVAAAGGTQQALIVDANATQATTEFLATMNAVVASARP